MKIAKWMVKGLSPNMRYSVKQSIDDVILLDYPASRIKMRADSPMLASRARNSCHKEPETVAWIEQYLKPGEVFYDIGANVGAYSLLARHVMGPGSKVYAFEPSFSTFPFLCRNILLNDYQGDIIPFQIGLSNMTGLREVHYSDLRAGKAMHALGEPVTDDRVKFKPAATQKMMSFCLDDFVKLLRLAPPDHLKIDVGAAIVRVLQGAAAILPKAKTLFLGLPNAPEAKRQAIELIENAGFIHVNSYQKTSGNLENSLYINKNQN